MQQNKNTDLSIFTFGKVPPQNRDIEQAILGAILLETHVITEVSSLIVPTDFYLNSHKLVYESMIEMYSNNENIDIFTIVAKLKKAGTLDEIGGQSFIHN